MKNKLFPTLIVDDFLEDPDDLVNYFKTLECSYDEGNVWPGKRTPSLHEINRPLFNYLGEKILDCYNIDNVYGWTGAAHFQIVNKNYSFGWVHPDVSILTTIIYLNKSYNLNSGTSLYKPKKPYNRPVHSDKKVNLHKKISENDDYKLTEEDISYLNDNNNLFQETLNVKNVYNRMFSFEGSTYHSANDFSGDEDRLTLVYFFYEINISRNRYPLVSAMLR